jgi:hypothetical protein
MSASSGKPAPRSAPRDAEQDDAHDDPPGLEPWLVVGLLSFVPIAAAAVLPRKFLWPLAGVAAALFVVSVILLMAQLRRKSRRVRRK